jgi:prepilin-type processing-associated H-X9-DG protein
LSPFYNGSATVAFTNYVGNGGTHYWYYNVPFNPQPPAAYYTGLWWEENGCVRFADVTDGLSNTLMFSERARGRYPSQEQPYWGWWVQGFGGDIGFITFHPINSANTVTVISTNADFTKMFGSAGSFHPGGANFCFADGSVRFLSETIDSWDLDDNDVTQLWFSNILTRQPKLYQWLSTRNRDEVLGEF